MKSKKIIFALLVACLVPLVPAGCCKDRPAEKMISDRIFEYVVINASPQEVWSYAWGKGIKMDRATGQIAFEWYPWMVLSDYHGKGVGGSSQYVIDIEGEKYTGTSVAIEHVPGQKHVAKLFGDVEGVWTLLCVPHENGTKLIIIDEYSLLGKPGTKMSVQDLADLLNRHTIEALKTVKEKVEGK